jgi:hypothetical protein
MELNMSVHTTPHVTDNPFPQPLPTSRMPASRTRRVLVQRVLHLMDIEGLATRVHAHPGKLKQFVDQASKKYRRNPYHNWVHATEVTHCAAWFVSRNRLSRGLPPADRFWLLIAAIGHDLAHPGHNNQWEIATASPLARRYRNQAVLEQHSLQVLRELMAQPECDFAETMAEEDQMRGAVLLPELIRATDFATHRDFVSEFRNVVEACDGRANLNDPAVRLLIMKAVIKAADISNTAQPFAQARRWARKVMAEMWAQGRKEKALGMPVGPLNDESRITLQQAQIGFIEYAALELFQSLARIEPETETIVRTLRANLARYREGSHVRARNSQTESPPGASV